MARKVSRVPLGEGWDFLTSLKWQAKLFAYDAQYGVSDGYLTVKEAEKADKEFHEIMNKWIPKVETEICLAEIEMDNAPDIKEYESILNGNVSRAAKKANRRKANIRYHKADHRHGKPVPQSDKKFFDQHSGTFYRWDEKKKTFRSHKKPVIHRNRKTFRDRLNSAMDAREREDARFFTGFGELLEDIAYLEDRIHIYEEDIKDLEYEKAFGYLTDCGEEFLEDYKKELEELKEYKQYKEILLRTATH